MEMEMDGGVVIPPDPLDVKVRFREGWGLRRIGWREGLREGGRVWCLAVRRLLEAVESTHQHSWQPLVAVDGRWWW